MRRILPSLTPAPDSLAHRIIWQARLSGACPHRPGTRAKVVWGG